MSHLVNYIYIFSAAMFVMSLKWMNSPATARRGVFAGEIGMLMAVTGTLLARVFVLSPKGDDPARHGAARRVRRRNRHADGGHRYAAGASGIQLAVGSVGHADRDGGRDSHRLDRK